MVPGGLPNVLAGTAASKYVGHTRVRAWPNVLHESPLRPALFADTSPVFRTVDRAPRGGLPDEAERQECCHCLGFSLFRRRIPAICPKSGCACPKSAVADPQHSRQLHSAQ
jgi:hypothetical protein